MSDVMDVRKTVTDAGYIAIGLGVMGYQQAQIRRRELHHASSAQCPAAFEERGREVQGFLAEGSRQIGARGVAARGRAEDQVRDNGVTGAGARRRGRQARRARRRARAGRSSASFPSASCR